MMTEQSKLEQNVKLVMCSSGREDAGGVDVVTNLLLKKIKRPT
jgi:hypothetical protein